MNAIELKQVSKSYPDFKLNNISFSLPTGTIMGLVGENGAGKSTTIKLIMNAITADSGSIMVLGNSNQSSDFTKIKEEIGIVLDEAYFPEILNAKELNVIMKASYKNWDPKAYQTYLKQFKLPLIKKIKDYSKGMKMKLAIATALAHHPKLLILDEPTSGLDPMARDEILNVFNDYTRDENHSILLSSHIISDLEKICDYISFIHKGNLILCDEKDLLLEKYAIIKISQNDFSAIPTEAIIRKQKTNYGYELLVNKHQINESFTVELTSLEDIILFMAKEDD